MKTATVLLLTSLSLVSCALPQKETTPVKTKTYSIRTTAYTHGESDHLKYGRKTAIGTNLKAKKTIAADLSVFPIGTQIKIADVIYVVEDYGSALVKPENVIPTVDVYQPSKSQMRDWGTRFFEVEIIEWGSFEKSAKLLKDRLRYSHCRVMYSRIQKKL